MLDGGGIGDAAVGFHQEELSLEPLFSQQGLEVLDIAAHLGADKGIHHHGGGALVFAVFARQFMGCGDEPAGVRLGDFGCALLMHGIAVGVQEADGNGLGTLGLCFVQHLDQMRFIQRRHHFAARIEPLTGLQPVFARDKGFVAPEQVIEGFGAVAAADFQHVAESFGGDERGLCAVFLETGIDHQRRAVNEDFKLSAGFAELCKAVGDAACRIVGRRGRLGEPALAGAGIHGSKVGEGAADVDGDADGVC